MKKGQHIIGGVQLKSSLSIQEIGTIISDQILGGIKLDGLEKNIYDEVPAIFCGVLGFSVVLHGHSGMDDNKSFWFDIIPNFSSDEDQKETIDLGGTYLKAFFINSFKDHPAIRIVESETNT